MKILATALTITLVGIHTVYGQGFVNLDFESANLSGFNTGSVPASNAIPGWTAYIGGVPLTNINYNIGVLGGIEVSIFTTNAIQGNYSVFIQGQVSTSLNINDPVSIGQTGTIPATAQSLTWWGLIGFGSVEFNGQALSVSFLGHTANYNIYGVNISQFAGQPGQLLFTSTGWPASVGSTIDDLQFSSSPIPEPGVLSLFALGGLGFLWRRRRFC